MDCHRPVNAELYEVKWKKEPLKQRFARSAAPSKRLIHLQISSLRAKGRNCPPTQGMPPPRHPTIIHSTMAPGPMGLARSAISQPYLI